MLSWFSGDSKDTSTESNAEDKQETAQNGKFKRVPFIC